MCRSIKTLRGAQPHASDDDMHAAALQFVRKVSGFREPSRRNAPAFNAAVEDIQAACARLLDALESTSARAPAA